MSDQALPFRNQTVQQIADQAIKDFCDNPSKIESADVN